jgi:hypothetical protein
MSPKSVDDGLLHRAALGAADLRSTIGDHLDEPARQYLDRLAALADR